MTCKKLPKAGQVLSFFIEYLEQANPTKAKCASNGSLAAKETCNQIKQIWTHLFGLVMITGKDQETEKIKDDRRKMIIDYRKIKEKVINIHYK